jgi:hypothetical protein
MLNVNENEIVNKNEISDADLEMVAGSGRYPLPSCGCSSKASPGGFQLTVLTPASIAASIQATAVLVV